MKLRQKLAVVLASAMVVTAVPVVTMAASKTTISKVVTTSDTSNKLGDNAPTVEMELGHQLRSDAFYINLEGAEWADWEKTKTEITTNGSLEVIGYIVPTSKTEANVEIEEKYLPSLKADTKMYFSLENAIVKKDEAYVVIDGEGTEVTSAKVLFGKKNTSKATVTAANDKTFYTTSRTGEDVGAITLSEEVVGTFKDAQTIKIELENSDFEFLTNQEIKVTGLRGFSNLEQSNIVEDYDVIDDNTTLEIKLKAIGTTASTGKIKIEGIKVKSVEKAPSTGDLEVTVSGDKIEDKTVAVAKIAEYGTILSVSEKKDVVSGKDVQVEIKLKETTEDSLAKADVEFVLDQGTLTKIGDTKVEDYDEDLLIRKDNKKDGDVIGFVMSFTDVENKAEELKKKITIQTELDMSGDITVTSSGRFVETQEVVVATATQNVTTATDQMVLKVGQSKQVGGKLEIKEAVKGAFEKGEVITVELADEDGISFTELPKLDITGNVKAKVEWLDKTTKGAVQVTITKQSTEPSTITLSDFEVKVDRTVPQGSYDLVVTTNKTGGELKTEDFFLIGTANTEELAANGLRKGTAKFTIGSKVYTVNDTEYTMDAEAFIKAPGYTMIPVRYVATAFGVEERDILFAAGSATIFAGDRTIQLTAGSDVAIVNGAPVKMATKVVIENGRTYAPIGEIAQLLGIDKNWEPVSKVATFINE